MTGEHHEAPTVLERHLECLDVPEDYPISPLGEWPVKVVKEEVEREANIVSERLRGQLSLVGFAEVVAVDEIQIREGDPEAVGPGR